MVLILNASHLPNLSAARRDWFYNAMDCCVPQELMEVLEPRLLPEQRLIYEFEMATQSPAMAMMRRGVLIDTAARDKAIRDQRKDLTAVQRTLNKRPELKCWDAVELVTGHCKVDGKRHKWPRGEPDATRRCEKCDRARQRKSSFNPGSHQQTWHLLYDLHHVPWMRNKKGDVSVDEYVLERVARKHKKLKDICDLILDARGIKKQIGVLKSELSPSGRMMSSFNVGAPETGRWSSSKNPEKLGTNLQNLADKVRRIVVADEGRKLGYFDLEQAESCCVAYVSGDEGYIAAHKSGDVHTYVCRMLWPDLPWTGDLKKDKVIAKQPAHFDPDHSYRDNSKRCQHGMNYVLTPKGIAAWAHIPLHEAERAYDRYFGEFPGIKTWQRGIKQQVKEERVITTCLGRRRQFFGRYWDMHVVRQAVAFIPQSMVADILNVALWNVWRDLDDERGLIELLAQVHDAILLQFPEHADLEMVGEEMRARMEIPVEVNGRTMIIPTDYETGYNWGHYHKDDNPRGMR